MGVHGLWDLLSPVGRRVSVETLAGKKLAIDASIWMIQFMKAMRDDKGEMVRNAHILGFFRRICKLLFLRTKPVFVFDGGTPALKRRTVIARRRLRENAQAKIRKTAEKLLLNHLKAMRLKELAADLERQRQNNDVKGKRAIIEEESVAQKAEDEAGRSYNQEELDEMLAASLAAEEDEGFPADASTSGARVQDDEAYADDDEDEDEEMILPEMHGKVDPAVLAALPPSMQLDLLVQMREKLMAENRQKYQKVKKAPARFSELQIQAYLKTVAFRREIDGVQKAAAGKGIGGVQTSRIASEANREFIFSSSFTGDKQALASSGKERTNDGENHTPLTSSTNNDGDRPPSLNSSSSVVNEATPKKRSCKDDGPTTGETRKAFHDDVETYLDERGRLRVSRVRALGIRMTRDLQRNLDLMKEIEQEKEETNQNENNEIAPRNLVDVSENSSNGVEYQGILDQGNDELKDDVEKSEEPIVQTGTSIEISFEDINKLERSEEDTLFACLVAGEPVMDFSVDDPASAKQSSPSPSDCEWEEGVIEAKSKSYPSQGEMSDDGEIEWEDGSQDIQMKASHCPEVNQQPLKKGDLEEDAEFQEAIKKSLEDMIGQGSASEHQKIERSQHVIGDYTDMASVIEEKDVPEFESSEMDVSRPVEVTQGINIFENNTLEALSADFIKNVHDESGLDARLLNQDSGGSVSLDGEFLVPSETLRELKDVDVTVKKQKGNDGEGNNRHAVTEVVDSFEGDVAHGTSVVSPVTDSKPEKSLESVTANVQQVFHAASDDHPQPGNLLESDTADVQKVFQAAVNEHSRKNEERGELLANGLVLDSTGTRELTKEKLHGEFSMDREENAEESSFTGVGDKHDVMEDNLDEEILLLDKEREELGSEQRKLERNAESVSSEMFAECQELLQMFGLPYIIAPMEAEAQCAYMEISNLVDGVVTDDSDAFLFGARSVYKNIFDDRKYVETYLMKDIEEELGLDREKLIRMALLLGSDYTEGVSGIGIVNAIEVVNAFPEKDGLREFREWIESPDPTILGTLHGAQGSSTKRKGSTGGESGDPHSGNDVERIKQIFMDKHRNVSKNWHIPSSFPSDAVISAYEAPQVDKSTEPFSWGKPDHFVLRKLCWEKFGWGASKADEVLLPVLKEYNKHETQLRLEAFYTFNERFAKIRSKRIKKAVRGIAGDKSSKVVDETNLQPSRSGKKRKLKPSEDEIIHSGEDSIRLEHTDGSHQTEKGGKPNAKQVKGKKMKGKVSGMNLEHPTSLDGSPDARKETRGLGKQRGRGRGQSIGRGKKKKNSCGDTESSHSDGSCSERDVDLQPIKSDEPPEVRRSGRLRKTVNYTVSDEFDDDIDKENENRLNDGASNIEPLIEAVCGINEASERELLNESFDVEKQACVNETGQVDMAENMEVRLLDDNENNDNSKQGDLSKDYLQFGGGFCVEEDDGMDLDGHLLSPARETTPETCNVPNDETPPNIVSPNGRTDPCASQTDVNYKPQDDYSLPDPDGTENNSGDENVVGFLRAMPYLRRKKRKSIFQEYNCKCLATEVRKLD